MGAESGRGEDGGAEEGLRVRVLAVMSQND